MTTKESIAILNNVTGTFKGTRSDHIKIELALSTLDAAINELEEFKAEELAVEASKKLVDSPPDEALDPANEPDAPKEVA